MKIKKVSWVNLDEDLIKFNNGTYKGKFNWKSSVGCVARFLDNDVIRFISIVDYMRYNKKDCLTVEFNKKEFEISTTNFVKCRLGNIIGLQTKEFIYSINQEVNGIIITDRDRIINKKGNYDKSYKYICKKCGFNSSESYYKKGVLKEELWITEYNIKNGQGCSCCSGKIVVPSINSLWKTHNYMIEDFGISEYDSKRYTYSSDEKIDVVCPSCKKNKNISIRAIYTNDSIGCNCGDGFSYPEKFMMSVLNQLGLKYKTQYTPKWEGLKRVGVKQSRAYDFYLHDYNIIIETHGIQHYKESLRGRSLKEEQQNDREKEQIAWNNGIVKYIVVDCRYSDMEWIKGNILKSELNNMFNLVNVDWLKCDLFATNDLKIEICKYKKLNPNSSTSVIAKVFNVCIPTVIEYLKWGNLNGYCEYYAKEDRIKAISKNGKLNGKPVEVFKDGVSLGVFESCSELERQSEERFGVKLCTGNISAVCNGKYMNNTYKGYSFKYVN